MAQETAPVREGEELNEAALTAYLEGKIDGVSEGLQIRQFANGNSNLTYLLTAGGTDYVLRRAPLGPLAPKSHDMVREYRLLEKLYPNYPLAPKVVHLCEDQDVIGAVFYLMERRHGVVIREALPEEYSKRAGVTADVSEGFVDCLAQLHSVDVEETGLISIGKPQGFLQRQLTGWTDRWYRAQTEPLPDMDLAIAWLEKNLPPSGAPALVHNDFKLDNLMLDPQDPKKVVAVLDWEMTTVGDPLVDLGLTLSYWLERGSIEDRSKTLYAAPGWYSRDQFLARYAEKTGRDLSHMTWYEVYGVFKVAVIVQQIYSRYFKGQTRNERFKNFNVRVRALVKAARELTEA